MDYHLRAADRMWPVLNRLMQGHKIIYEASGGRIGHRVPGAPPMLLLDNVGAKSPAWFHNLRVNPETTVQVGTERRAVHARVAEPEEHDRLWPKAVATYGGYRGYQERTDRRIPLVVLEPRRP